MKGDTYYNEHDRYPVMWLNNLMRDGHIRQGRVDGRDLQDVQADDLKGYRVCHFFAGIAGWDYALTLADWPEDREIWTGSCPCQPFSSSGLHKGREDERHLWPSWFRLIKERHPHAIVGEQVEHAIAHGWWDEVAEDLEGEGYAVGAVVLGAHSIGAPHLRQRFYFLALAEKFLRKMWMTPVSQMGGGLMGGSSQKTAQDQARNLLVPHGRMSNGSRTGTERALLLNPELSRWLMGFPEGWHRSTPTEMQLSRKSQRKSSR